MSGQMRDVESISAFFPCFNDEHTIAKVVESVVVALEETGAPYEVIVVNDGSVDGSAAVLEGLSARVPALRVVEHESNRGYGAALISGFAAARHQWVFYTDGDGQYDPTELLKLIERAAPDVDVVQGYKLRRADGVGRALVGRLFHWSVARSFGLRVRDTHCDFRLLRRSVVTALGLESQSGAICVELLRKLESHGARVAQVGVHHYPRVAGRSQFFRPKHITRTLADIVALWFRLVAAPKVRRTPMRDSKGDQATLP